MAEAGGVQFINDSKAKVHTVNGSALLVTPGLFQRYAQEKGSFPATAGVAVVPPGMEDYIASTDWTKTASIGGNYRWVNIPSSDPDRGSFEMGALMVAGATLSLEEFELIDGWIDDGSTNTGNFIVGGAGSMILYYVEN